MEIIPAILLETLMVTFPPTPTRWSTPTPVPLPTFTPYSSRTPFPSLTPLGTVLPGVETPETTGVTRAPTEPGETLVPSSPDGQPVSFSGGSGIQMFSLDGVEGPSVVMMRHAGPERFEVQLFSAKMASLGSLISTTGPYLGARPLNFAGSNAKTMTVRTSGVWQMDILPLAEAHSIIVPDAIEGEGDDVVLLAGGEPGQVMISATGESGLFVIEGFSRDPLRSLGDLLTATLPYSGTLQVDPGVKLLVIEVTGPWKLQLSGR